jgi:hypothetical protein
MSRSITLSVLFLGLVLNHKPYIHAMPIKNSSKTVVNAWKWTQHRSTSCCHVTTSENYSLKGILQRFYALIIFCFSLLPGLGQASSPDAWEEFRLNVKRSCLRASSDIQIKKIHVDDWGTGSYGFAIVSGSPKNNNKITLLRVCVYDKKSQEVEIIEIGDAKTINSLFFSTGGALVVGSAGVPDGGATNGAISKTPNQTGAWLHVAPKKASPPIANLWGYDDSRPPGNRLSQNAVSHFKPIDSMTLTIGNESRELRAFANVDKYGNYDKEGDFQCTALISQYLSLLGFTKAPTALPNGKDVVARLVEGANKEFFSPIDATRPPQVGSIISMEAGVSGIADQIGHVAIVKGVSVAGENRISVNLIEQNIPGTNQFSVNRAIEFSKGSDGRWSAVHSIAKNSPHSYSVLNWTTPTKLP